MGSAALDPASSASADLRFASSDYDEAPPRDASVPGCDADVRIADMDFDGDGLGIIAGIIGLFEGLIAGVVEDELRGTVCSELRGLGDDALDDLLIALSDEMDAYLRPLEGSLADPLFLENGAEQQLPMIENGEDGGESEPLYLDFQQLEDYAGDWVGAALDQFASFLGPSDSDPYGQLGICPRWGGMGGAVAYHVTVDFRMAGQVQEDSSYQFHYLEVVLPRDLTKHVA